MAAATTFAGVSKRYRRCGVWALDGVDLVLAAGTTTIVVGGNGSGKSTLVRIATGVTLPTRGAVTGRPAAVGYAPERLPAQLRMTARVYLGHMARLRGLNSAAAGRVAEELFACFDLQPGPDVPIRTLSKGNNQKVALAQAFLAPVGLLALDEPTSGLDEPGRIGLWELVERRRAGGSAVLVTSPTPLSGIRFDVVVGLAAGRAVVSGGAPGGAPVGAFRIEIVGVEAAAVAARRGVVSARADGPVVVVVVTREEADAVLLWALQHRSSVRSVQPIEKRP